MDDFEVAVDFRDWGETRQGGKGRIEADAQTAQAVELGETLQGSQCRVIGDLQPAVDGGEIGKTMEGDKGWVGGDLQVSADGGQPVRAVQRCQGGIVGDEKIPVDADQCGQTIQTGECLIGDNLEMATDGADVVQTFKGNQAVVEPEVDAALDGFDGFEVRQGNEQVVLDDVPRRESRSAREEMVKSPSRSANSGTSVGAEFWDGSVSPRSSAADPLGKSGPSSPSPQAHRSDAAMRRGTHWFTMDISGCDLPWHKAHNRLFDKKNKSIAAQRKMKGTEKGLFTLLDKTRRCAEFPSQPDPK